MNRVLPSRVAHPAFAFIPIFALLVLFSAGFLNAQSLSTDGTQAAPSPGDPSASANAAAPESDSGVQTDSGGFGQTPGTPANGFTGSGFGSGSNPGAFEPGFGNRAGAGGGMGFRGAVGQQAGSGFGGPNLGRPDLGSLYQMANDLSRSLGAGKSITLGSTSGTALSLNQPKLGKLSLSTHSSNFRLSYQNSLLPEGRSASGVGPGSAVATYNSSHDQNEKVDFSASAIFGAGGPAGFMGAGGNSLMNGTGAQISGYMGSPINGSMDGRPASISDVGPGGAAQKHPVTSLSLHLSF
jgi:hypothetical protein